jgi:uncharacterized protein
MNEGPNTKLIQSIYDGFKRRDLPAVLAVMAPDIDWVVPPMNSVPIGGSRKGTQRVAEYFKQLGEMIDLQRFEITGIIAQGQQVAAVGRSSGLVRKTGKRLDDEFVHVWTIRDGQVARLQNFLDTGAVIEACRE